MKNYQIILRKVGWCLIIIGIIDIGIMLWCSLTHTNYSSIFNIFAVIAGILLLRNSLKTARIVAWFAAFMIAIIIITAILTPFLFPFDLLLIYLRISPLNSILAIGFAIFATILFIWLYVMLTNQSVLAAMDEALINYKLFLRNPKGGYWVGVFLTIILFALLYALLNGEQAQKAKEYAETQIGNGYKFHVKSINVSISGGKTHVQAIVTAYNNKEIKNIPITWSE